MKFYDISSILPNKSALSAFLGGLEFKIGKLLTRALKRSQERPHRARRCGSHRGRLQRMSLLDKHTFNRCSCVKITLLFLT